MVVKNKFLVKELDKEGNVIREKEFKSLSDICRETKLEHHQCRNLYLYCSSEVKKKIRPFLYEISKRLVINSINEPDLGNMLKPN